MLRRRILSIAAFIYTILILSTCSAFSQDTKRQNNNMAADDPESNYIPSWYAGAENYNLLIAASQGDTAEIRKLIDKGADVNTYN